MLKVYVDVGESRVHTNGLSFSNVEDAEAYARDLFSRWFLVREWFVAEDQGPHFSADEIEALAVASSKGAK